MKNISMVLQSNLERIVEKGDVELGIFENMIADNFERNATTVAVNYFG